MSNSDNDSNRESGRGKSAGSRTTQFSSQKQPIKRRKRKPRSDLGSGMLDALTETITITKADGTKQTIEVHRAFTKSIVHDSLRAPLPQKLKALAAMHKFGLAEILSARSKLDAERTELEAERRDFDRQQHQARQLAELNRVEEAQLKADYHAVASILVELRDSTEWGEGSERMRERVEGACRTFEQDCEMRARVARLVEEACALVEQDEERDEDEWDEEDDCGDRDDDDGADRVRENSGRHDPTTDGAIDYDPAEFDESTMPNTHDPDDPALDLTNTHISAEDLIAPAGDDGAED